MGRAREHGTIDEGELGEARASKLGAHPGRNILEQRRGILEQVGVKVEGKYRFGYSEEDIQTLHEDACVEALDGEALNPGLELRQLQAQE